MEAAQAREADSDNLSAWKLNVLSLQLAGRLAAAEEEVVTALKRFSGDADLWFYQARVQYLQFEFKNAGQSARKAIQLDPKHADAHTQLGMILEAQQEFAGALTYYVRSIELNREQRRSLTLPMVKAGQLLSKLGRMSEALEQFTSAEIVDPRSSEIHLERARVLERLARIREAESEYEQAVAIDGNKLARSHLERIRAGAAAGKPAASGTSPAAGRGQGIAQPPTTSRDM
ncbi:MAG TPA: tetratricopeptide repeat protein, partial [Blastocatellia bacterium]|nr:tetratricopeptide repeat protein [Blastocatellia bacterium]